MINFQDLLKLITPEFMELSASAVFPRDQLYILYIPTNPILTKMFKAINVSHELKTYKTHDNALPIIETWKFLKVFEYTYLDIEIESFSLLENVDVSRLSIENMSNTPYHVETLTYSSHVFGRYGYELSISKDWKSAYLSLMYVLKAAMYSMYPNEKIPEITITILPNSIYYGLEWPCAQLLFYYLLFGCILLHLKTVRRLSAKSILPQKRWYAIINYSVLNVQYFFVYFIIYFLTSLTICTDYFNAQIMYNISWNLLLGTFIINTITILLFAVVLCEMNMSTYNLLYFVGMLMAPQMLFVFAFGQNNGLNCLFQYLTCLSPLLAVSWSLIALEVNQIEHRYNLYEVDLYNEFMNKCFSFYSAIIFQVLHIFCYILIIFYMNFLHKKVLIMRRRRLKRVKKFRRNLSLSTKSRSSKKKYQSQYLESQFSTTIESSSNKQVLFPKSDYIITMHKVVKIFKVSEKIRKILKGVSFKIRRNKITTILGPNGSGKTTLLNILSGVYTINSGNILINGKSVITNRSEAYSHISKYIDDLRFFYFLKVSEYFELIIHKNKIKNYEILHHRLVIFIEICQLQKYLNITLKYCSVSIIRVIKIICTFLSEKQVILLDDPMEGLDYILMQSICALLINQKSIKTIIYTSCNSDTIEYVSDSVIVLINGRKVSQTDVENFNLDKMLYKLVCSMEPDTSDYTLTRYMKLTFPMIKYDETVDGVAYFNVPQMQLDDLWNLLNKLDRYGNKLGIWRYKFLSIGMRHFLANAYDYYLQVRKKKRIIFNKFDVLPEKIKEKSVIYKKYFFLIMGQRIISYCRYPNRLVMRFFIPIIMLIIWTSTTSLSHPTVFLIDDGFFGPSYEEEINSQHQIFICCEGNERFCRSILRTIQVKMKFIKTRYALVYDDGSNFQTFQKFLSDESDKDTLGFKNLTLFAIYFATRRNKILKSIIMANDYKSMIFAYNIVDNIMMKPKEILINKLERIDLIVQRDMVEINFLLRLIMVILFAYSMTTYRYVAQSVQQQFYIIHNLARVHFSLLYVPTYIMDVCLYLLIMCFMILFIYILHDHEITIVTCNIVDLMSIYFLFVLADSSFKLLIEYFSNYNPIMIFILKCMDIFIIFYLNIIYSINYIIKLQKYSYGGLKTHDTLLVAIEVVLKLIFPAANLNAALKFEEGAINNLNGILFIQWISYISLIFLWHYQRFRIIEFLKKLWCFKISSKQYKLKNVGLESSFLFVKDVGYFHKNRMFFENITIEFSQGSVWGIIARNDCGKTYFLNILLGKKTPTSGGIYLYNNLVNSLYSRKRNVRIGFCSENRFYIPDLTVEETLMYWSRIQLLPEYSLQHFVTEILNILLLHREIKTRVNDLSLPNIKKLDIAIAIIGYPEIIILDDPLSTLDSLARQGVINLIERAKSNNCTVIITSSEVADLRHTLTHIAILDEKRLVYTGLFVDAISNSKFGYYLTIFLSHEYLSKKVGDKLTALIQKTFKDSLLFKFYQYHLIYFIPFQSLADPNTTKILLFMETIRAKYKFKRFLIKYDVYFANSM